MKTTNHIFKYIFILLILSSANSFAQKKGGFERIKAQKVAYITDELDLTSQEAEKFWPIYNSFEKKIHQLRVVDRKAMIEKIDQKGGIDQLTDKEVKKMSLELIERREAIFKTKKEKNEKLSQVLSAKKFLKLQVSEKGFNKRMLKKLHRKQKGNSRRR